jgi:hypothetical protein
VLDRRYAPSMSPMPAATLGHLEQLSGLHGRAVSCSTIINPPFGVPDALERSLGQALQNVVLRQRGVLSKPAYRVGEGLVQGPRSPAEASHSAGVVPAVAAMSFAMVGGTGGSLPRIRATRAATKTRGTHRGTCQVRARVPRGRRPPRPGLSGWGCGHIGRNAGRDGRARPPSAKSRTSTTPTPTSTLGTNRPATTHLSRAQSCMSSVSMASSCPMTLRARDHSILRAPSRQPPFCGWLSEHGNRPERPRR